MCACVCLRVCVRVGVHVCVCVCIYRRPLPTLRACHLAPAIAPITCALPAPRHPYMLCPLPAPALSLGRRGRPLAPIAPLLISPHLFRAILSHVYMRQHQLRRRVFYAGSYPPECRETKTRESKASGCWAWASGRGGADAQLCGPYLERASEASVV